jgi:superfamily II DNA or RNA helicase
MEDGGLQLVIANRVFEKGINIKALDCIIDGTAGKSANGVKQRFGRGVRTLADKGQLVYFDVGDVGADNRFEAATRSRRKAIASLGVPTVAGPLVVPGGASGAGKAAWEAVERVLGRRDGLETSRKRGR